MKNKPESIVRAYAGVGFVVGLLIGGFGVPQFVPGVRWFSPEHVVQIMSFAMTAAVFGCIGGWLAKLAGK